MKKTQTELESRVIRGAHGVAAEEDHIGTAEVVRVGVVSLAIFLVGGIWAWRLQIATEKELTPNGAAPIPALITPDKNGQTAYEIGIINQRMFQQDVHAEQKISAQERALQNGWADQPGVVARPTISAAMDAVVAEQAATRQQAPTPTPAPAPEQPPAPKP
jgi:hypothetical protein